MAYRRKQQGTTTTVGTGLGRSGWRPSPISTTTATSSLGMDVGANKDLLEDVEDVDFDVGVEDDSSSTSLAAKAIRASSAAHRDSSLSSAYGFSHRFPPSSVSSSAATTTSFSTSKPTTTSTSSSFSKDSRRYEYTSVKSVTDEPKRQGFWGSLARKAKSFLDDNDLPDQVESPGQSRYKVPDFGSKAKYQGSYASNDNNRKMESPKSQKGLNAISSSLNYIGNAVGEGLTIVENRTADIIQETRKHIRKKPSGSAALAQGANCGNSWQQTQPQCQTQSQNLPQLQTDLELQLKASRDVAMAMAAKAKLLLRDLKTVKADLAFAKERCAQLEDENRVLRENRERGGNLEDDDLIRLQLETLLAEKARLAHENSAYARENRFLREVVEYHQLTMQDVIYLDEGTEEITEVYPIKVVSNTQPISPTNLNVSLPSESTIDTCLGVTGNICPVRPPGVIEVSQSAAPPISYTTTKT